MKHSSGMVMFFGIFFRYPKKWGHSGGLVSGCLGGGVSGFGVSLVNLGFSGSFLCNSFLGYLSTPNSVWGSNLMRTIRQSAKTATIIAIKPASRGNNVDAS